MSHNQPPPHQGPQEPDPAASTQMFQAFVNDQGVQGRRAGSPAPQAASGPRIGLIVGAVVALALLGAVAWLAIL